MTKEEARAEINYRIERETRYVLALVHDIGEYKGYVLGKIEDNSKTLALLGKYLEVEHGDTWEKFYRENYWEKTSEKK